MPSSPDARVYRGVLVGLGGIARSGHLPAFQSDPRVAARLHIVGILDDAAAAPPPPSCEGIPLLSRPEQLADLGALYFFDICTPTSSHLSLSLCGPAPRYHALLEKRCALNRAGHPR